MTSCRVIYYRPGLPRLLSLFSLLCLVFLTDRRSFTNEFRTLCFFGTGQHSFCSAIVKTTNLAAAKERLLGDSRSKLENNADGTRIAQ
jgi:hypothetical protein